MALEESVQPIFKDQAPTTLEESPFIVHSKIKPQGPLKIRSPIHQSIKPQRSLEETIVHPKIKPRRPFGSTTSTNLHNCSSLDQAPTALWINSPIHKSTSHEDRIRGSNCKRDCNPKNQIHKYYFVHVFLSRFVSGNFRVYKFGTPSGTISTSHLYLQTRKKAQMASRKDQAVPATKAKNKSVLAAGGDVSGITTLEARQQAISAASSTPASCNSAERTQLRYEPVITLASLRAPREAQSPPKSTRSCFPTLTRSSSTAMQVMTTGATSIEEQLAQMNEAIAKLTRTVEEKDLQIAALANRLGAHHEEGDGSGIKKDADEEDEPPVEKVEEKREPDQPAALLGSLSIQQLQEMIANTIKAQYEGSSYTSVLYSKPYSKKIDALRMPRGYQPPKFMQFDGKGNPKQHVAHFVETCNNAGTEGDYLAKQFVRSLKGNAFEWYTDLEPESINSWEQLEKEFLNRFYSTRHTVSMLELTSAKQWRDEPVVDYINRWRNLSLDCKDRLSEISSIEMCVQGMQWGLHYILQGIKPRTFEELATRAHDMELSIAHHGKKEPISDFKKDKVLLRRWTITGRSLPRKLLPLTLPRQSLLRPSRSPPKTKQRR